VELPLKLYCDSKATISIACSLVQRAGYYWNC
jgi:hypothetical protein